MEADNPASRHSMTSSTNTYLMPASPKKSRSPTGYKPTVSSTLGQKPACLVNASVTYCGNDTIYAFGGFDQYTDEVYNHVLKLDLSTLQWTLVDNYGDIPGVRMGHTACLWQDTKLLVYGGENEHREYLSDVIILDLQTSQWTQPPIRGILPKGRARHAAAVHDNKLFIVGGLSGADSHTLDDICYLDLNTWTWSRPWTFVARFDHSCWIWGGRVWVCGGISHSMEQDGDLWWLDLQSSPAFGSCANLMVETTPSNERYGRSLRAALDAGPFRGGQVPVRYPANSSSVQKTPSGKTSAPGAVSSVQFVSGTDVPSASTGTHFFAFSSGSLLDFSTPGPLIRFSDCNLAALDLVHLRWQKLASAPELFDPVYRWHYCVVNGEGTKAWLLGRPMDAEDGSITTDEYLSVILPLDLTKFGLLGNDVQSIGKNPAFAGRGSYHQVNSSSLGDIGTDLASMFDPANGVGSDFSVTALRQDHLMEDDNSPTHIASSIGQPPEIAKIGADETTSFEDPCQTSRPIFVHKLILQARWPHFNRLYNAEMAEFQTKRLHVPEPYDVVRAFLYYLYTDSISYHETYCRDLDDVAGLLVMAHLYDMPRLRLLCLHRLSRELDVEHAALIWERAGAAQDEWLQQRAATYCLTHWGRVVRTDGFRQLSRRSMVELCEVIDIEGRVVGGEELEVIGGLGGSRIGGPAENQRKKLSMPGTNVDDGDGIDEGSMEMG